MSSNSDRKIRDVRDLWGCRGEEKENPRPPEENSIGIPVDNSRAKHKYKTLERHLSMKKTVRKKMMRDLKEIGDASTEETSQPATFLEQLKAEQPPPPNIDKPSLWKRLTKGWGHS